MSRHNLADCFRWLRVGTNQERIQDRALPAPIRPDEHRERREAFQLALADASQVLDFD
jgi:hypothetical protein